MNLKQIVFFGLWCVSCCYCATTRIWRHGNSCSKPGFSCPKKIDNRTTLIYECPTRLREYHIYINEFNGPRNLEALIIKNCKTLTVLFRCTKYAWEKKDMKYLQISNIEKLKFMNIPKHQSVIPPMVVFENITKIESIPTYTFTQTSKRINEARCFLPSYNLRSVLFRNVTIGKVQSKAFDLDNFENLTFSNVKIEDMDSSALSVNHNTKGLFSFEDGSLNRLNNSSFEIIGPRVILKNSVFTEIPSSAMKIQSTGFIFTNNSVLNLKPKSLIVVANEVVISLNRFARLESKALVFIEGTSDTNRSTFEFIENKINLVEDEGLIPNRKTFYNITIQKNIFSCTCAKAGLLLSKIDEDNQDVDLKRFYGKLFDEQSENRCISSCSLPLTFAKEKIIQGKCTDSLTVDDICRIRKSTGTESIYSSSSSSIGLIATSTGNMDTTLVSVSSDISSRETTESVEYTTSSISSYSDITSSASTENEASPLPTSKPELVTNLKSADASASKSRSSLSMPTVAPIASPSTKIEIQESTSKHQTSRPKSKILYSGKNTTVVDGVSSYLKTAENSSNKFSVYSSFLIIWLGFNLFFVV